MEEIIIVHGKALNIRIVLENFNLLNIIFPGFFIEYRIIDSKTI